MSRKEIRTLVDGLKTNQIMYLLQYVIKVKLKITNVWYLRYLNE